MLPINSISLIHDLPLHGGAASRLIEQSALASLPPHTLMQRAASAVAALARAIAPHARRIWVACGPGNNGGDGLLAATLLHRQLPRSRVLVSWHGDEARLPDDARFALQQARASGVTFCSGPPTDFDLGIDALLGLGSRGLAAGPMADWMQRLQQSPSPVLCIDLPSGLDPDSGGWRNPFDALPRGPRHTLSLLTLKPGLFTAEGRDAAGRVWFDPLGIDPDSSHADAWLCASPGDSSPSRHARHALHKGSHGDLLVIGGQDVSVNGAGMGGAALLAARAGLQAGAGRVYLALLGAGPSTPSLDPLWPELMFRPAQPSAGGELGRLATTVCGCGGGTAVQSVLPDLLEQSPRLVLDADGLNAIASRSDWRKRLSARLALGLHTILTPHPLEAARLLGCSSREVQSGRLAAAQRLADELECVVLLKGSGSVVAAPGHPALINPTGNALLATAGTGDVLAGMTGSYWAQAAAAGHSTLNQARRVAAHAAWQHGALADRWPAGQGLRAATLAEAVPCWRG
ncbi:MAG: hypothetical protein RLZZ555_1845 [Pseudomonadota bacterium]|jgi:hydroxyethylthiazole kinase-like uncharacterized protein yjeF